MKRRARTFGLIVAIGVAVGVLGYGLLNASEESRIRTVLLKTELADMPSKEGLVVFAVIPPGAETGKHTHPAHEFAYVLEGSGVLEIEGRPPIVLQPGVTIYQPPNEIHNGKNTSATAPLKILGVYIAEKDRPLSIPMK